MKKDKKKILYIVTKSNWGGAGRYVYDLATTLPADEYTPVVIAGGKGTLTRKLSEKNVRTISAKHLVRDVYLFNEFRAFYELLAILKKERPHVVHLNSAKASGLGALAARLRRVPCVIQTIHGWSFNEDRSFIWKVLVWIASYITALLVHKTIVVSKRDLYQTKRMPFIYSKTAYIQNALPRQALLDRNDARAVLSEMNNIPKGDTAIWIGTIAELHKNKGLEYGLKAMAKLVENNPHIYWIVIGDGEEKRKLLNSVGTLKKRVFFLGHIDDAAQYMKAFDIFMLPSEKEGLPYVLLEARAASIPIVSTDVGGVPEIVRDTAGIIVPPKNPEQLAEAIEILLSHPLSLQGGKDDFDAMFRATIALY